MPDYSFNAAIRDNIERGMHLDSADRLVLASGKLFSGQSTLNGYRRINLRAFGRNHVMNLHRVLCWLYYGEPTFEGADADHENRNTMDNARINLRWLTRTDNQLNTSEEVTVMRRTWMSKIGKEKDVRGEKHGSAKLTASVICEIRDLYRAGVSQQKIADRFGIVQPHVSRIIRGANWNHV